MMVDCPICGTQGHLQIRGNSARIGHYLGHRGSTRMVEWHKLDSQSFDVMVNNGNHGNQSMVNKKTAVVVGLPGKAEKGWNNLDKGEMELLGERTRSSARIEHRPPKSGVVGSNPTGPAIFTARALRLGSDPQEAILQAVNYTKDNDTIAAIVGTAMGALYGRSAFRESWLHGLLGRTRENDNGTIFQLIEETRLFYERV
jgi:hypothetical protein